MTWVWGLLAAAGLLWPDRLSGPLDGVPLDRLTETVLVGAVFPALWWLHRRFLTTRFARICILLLLGWKGVSASMFVQDGWCVRFEPALPYTLNQTGAPHAWDLRANWRDADPACSAIMTRSYRDFHEFPVWFFNLPPASESWPGPLDRPPGATTRMTIAGFLNVGRAGVLQFDTAADIAAVTTIDGETKAGAIPIAPGIHRIGVDAVLRGDRWQFLSSWNGGDLWATTMATVKRPSRLDELIRPALNWVSTLLAATLLLAWAATTMARVRDVVVLSWAAGASLLIWVLVSSGQMQAARWAVLLLGGAAFLPVPARLRNLSGAFLLVGVPWMTFVIVLSARAAGRFVLYDSGHDYWMFQRFAYRIVMQGYWLEGGSPTFWFQPLYRWIVGLLHMVFGESNIGEWFWDGACLLAGAMFSYRVVRRQAGFRWGLVGGAVPLAVFVLGTGQYLIGQGLGEISSAGFLSLAALCAMRSAHGSVLPAAAAGVLATLAFYTRLNNLPMAIGVIAFAWRPRASLKPGVTIAAIVACGVALFAWRTWYYTGVFSVFHGTQRDLLAIWQPGMTAAQFVQRAAASVMMVLTVNDPPRFDPYALPVLVGAAAAALGLARVPGPRRLPLAPCVYFLTAIVGAFVARGSAYPGRFSMHVIPIASALCVCAVTLLSRPFVENRAGAAGQAGGQVESSGLGGGVTRTRAGGAIVPDGRP
ncbi:MAG: hypothetical protein ABJA98_01430 [Acidobacteriota bacterium]